MMNSLLSFPRLATTAFSPPSAPAKPDREKYVWEDIQWELQNGMVDYLAIFERGWLQYHETNRVNVEMYKAAGQLAEDER